MSVLLSTFADVAWIFYIVIGIASGYFVLSFANGVRNLSRSAFAMERMRARGEISSALVRLLFCGFLAGVLYLALSLIDRSVTPIDRALSRPNTTPTPGIVVQYFGTPPPGAATASPALTATRAISLPLGPTPTALSAAALATVAAGGLPPNNCGSNLVRIDALAAPAKQLTITGTAFVEAGGQWRLELIPPGGGGLVLQRGEISALGPHIVRGLSVQTLAPGTYGARVTSFRADGTIGGVCQRSVGIGS